MASAYLYRYDADAAPDAVLEAAAALTQAGVDLDAQPWVRVDFTVSPPTATAHESAEEGRPSGASSVTVGVPALVLP